MMTVSGQLAVQKWVVRIALEFYPYRLRTALDADRPRTPHHPTRADKAGVGDQANPDGLRRSEPVRHRAQ